MDLNDPTFPFRASIEPLERIIEAAEAVKYEIEVSLQHRARHVVA